MDLLHAFLVLVSGVIAGLVAGFFALGEGILLVPILLLFYQSVGVTTLVATHLAFGTSLLVSAVAGVVPAYRAYRSGHLVMRAVIILGAGAAFAAVLGPLATSGMKGRVLQQIFAVVATVAALRLFSESRKPKGDRQPDLGLPALAGTGLVTGAVGTLSGVADTGLTASVLYSMRHFAMTKAAGTAAVATVIVGMTGGIGYALCGRGDVFLPQEMIGYVDPLRGLLLLPGAIGGTLLGKRLVLSTRTRAPRMGLALVLLIIAAKMFFVP
jgi:uncharacterized protein